MLELDQKIGMSRYSKSKETLHILTLSEKKDAVRCDKWLKVKKNADFVTTPEAF